MGLRINTNVSSLNTQRHLGQASVRLGKSMEKLASGLRINRAGDDAAGLAISEVLKGEVRTLDQAARNAADGISLVQTAEGALDEVAKILVRMKELAVQSRNGTLSDTDRSYLNTEYYTLTAEINRISWGTTFNGVQLLDGTSGNVKIQVGTNTQAYDSVTIDLSNDVDSVALPLMAEISNYNWAGQAIREVDLAVGRVSEVRGHFGAVQNRLEASIRNIQLTSENLSAANSRIRDVDVASETSSLASFQILQQAGVSILGQANQVPQLAFSLYN